MYEVIYWGDMPLHTLLLLLCGVFCTVLYVFHADRNGIRCTSILTHFTLTVALGFFLARAIYAAVCWYDVFLDSMGNFQGIGPFFSPSPSGMNVIGFLAGLLIAAPIAARLGQDRTAVLLDASVLPALMMYILARAIEPLTGQGYGDLMEMEVSVCWMEAVLTAVLLAVCLLLRRKCRRPGTYFQYALVLWCLVQILPESLRCDEALFVLVFARVTHLGLAVTLGLTLIRLLIAGRRHLSAGTVVFDIIGLAAGLGLAIGSIFALDKTNWPKPFVYLLMIAAIVWLGVVICRRIHKEDTFQEAAA